VILARQGVDAARRHHRRIGSHAMSDDATLMRQLRAIRRAALQAREEAQLAYQFAPNSYGALAQIELILVRLAIAIIDVIPLARRLEIGAPGGSDQ
jgi:hypothetical protein